MRIVVANGSNEARKSRTFGRAFRDGAREVCLSLALSGLFFAFMLAWLIWAAP